MTRTLKTLGLALLAVFALSAVAASAASADLFTSPNNSTFLTGATVTTSGKPTFEPAPGAGGVECAKGTYAGTGTGTSTEEVTVHPVYDGPCTFGGTAPATVNTDGCDYVLTGRTDGGNDATVEVECTSGKEITVSVWIVANHGTEPADVVLHIPGGQLLKGVHYTNKNTAENAAGSETVTVNATVTGIHATCTGEFCFLIGGETFTEGTYTDDVLVTGYADTGGMTQNPITHVWSGTHGSQIHINVSGS